MGEGHVILNIKKIAKLLPLCFILKGRILFIYFIVSKDRSISNTILSQLKLITLHEMPTMCILIQSFVFKQIKALLSEKYLLCRFSVKKIHVKCYVTN